MITGPCHFDYLMFKTNKKNEGLARLIFDARISQKIRFSIQVKKAIFELTKGLKCQRYNFNIKLKDGKRSSESGHSPPFSNPLYKKKSIKQLPPLVTPKEEEKFGENSSQNDSSSRNKKTSLATFSDAASGKSTLNQISWDFNPNTNPEFIPSLTADVFSFCRPCCFTTPIL